MTELVDAGTVAEPTPAAAPPADAAPATAPPVEAKVDPVPMLGDAPEASAPAEGTDQTTADAAPSEAAGTWPEDWRQRFAKNDEKLLKRLNRFASPENVLKSYLDLEKKMAGGVLKEALPENATDEQVAAYRKANGIPDAPDGYEYTPPAGVTFTEGDKAELDAFKAKFHELNLPADKASALLETYFARQVEFEQALHRAADEKTVEYRAELKAEYGRDYARNLNAARSWMDTVVGADVRNELIGVTLVDGTKLGDHPAFVRMIVQAGLAAAGDEQLAVAEFGGGGKSLGEQYREALDLKFTDEKAYFSAEHQEKLMRLSAAMAKNPR